MSIILHDRDDLLYSVECMQKWIQYLVTEINQTDSKIIKTQQ